MTKCKFVHISRVIDPKTRIHYLDAIDDQGCHWTAEMSHQVEDWLVFTRIWHKNAQQPYD